MFEPVVAMGMRFPSQAAAWLAYLAIAWTAAWTWHWTQSRRRVDDTQHRHWSQVAGIALVLWPFVRFTNQVLLSFGAVLDTSTVAGTIAAADWWAAIERRWWQYVLLPLVGLWFASGMHLAPERRHDIAHRLRHVFRQVDLLPRHTWGRTAAHGAWLLVVVALGYLALDLASRPLRALDTGDESAVFLGLTPALAFALAITAGVTEELLFRGILQRQAARFMPLWGAIALQSVFFGLIHSGYGTLGHVLVPALFGVLMGVITVRFGLMPAIIVHAGIDLLIFLDVTARLGHTWTAPLGPALVAVCLVGSALYFGLERARRGAAALVEAADPHAPFQRRNS